MTFAAAGKFAQRIDAERKETAGLGRQRRDRGEMIGVQDDQWIAFVT